MGEFWEQFGKSIKLGLVEDSSNRTKLSKLLRFKTSKSDGKWVSLEQYVENMKEDQEHIYYVTGESLEAVQNSPFLEQCKERDLEVLFLTEPIDEYAVQNLTEFDGKRLMSVTKEGLKFGGDEDVLDGKREKLYKEKFDKLTTFLKDTYGKTTSRSPRSRRPRTTTEKRMRKSSSMTMMRMKPLTEATRKRRKRRKRRQQSPRRRQQSLRRRQSPPPPPPRMRAPRMSCRAPNRL